MFKRSLDFNTSFRFKQESSTYELIELLFNIVYVIYVHRSISSTLCSKLREWCNKFVDVLELTYGPQVIKPKTHTIRHLHWCIRQIGCLSDSDTFALENLLSKVRRNLHSTTAPEIQGK